MCIRLSASPASLQLFLFSLIGVPPSKTHILKRRSRFRRETRLYLATTYASQYIPGAPSEENRQKGEAAIAEFRELLKIQPDNIAATDGIGSLLFMMAGQQVDSAMFNESKSFHQRPIQIRPEDPEPYYWIGVIHWTLAFRANREMREAFNRSRSNELAPADPLPDDLREQYAREYGRAIGEGLTR